MTAGEAVATAVDLTADEHAEQTPDRGQWVRGVGRYARCDNVKCTTRARGSVALYRTIHGEGSRAYATQLCVPCKLQEMAETFAGVGMLPEVDAPPKDATVADPEWANDATRKPVDGVLLNRQQFEHVKTQTLRLLNDAPGAVDQPDERGIELASVGKRKRRERSKVKAVPREELSGKRSEIGV